MMSYLFKAYIYCGSLTNLSALLLRAAVACREKWYEKLDPNLHRGPFTPEEDQLALALARRLPERHWSKISQCMDGRTDHMVMKRISSLTGTVVF